MNVVNNHMIPIQEFSKSTIEKLQYYVYTLIDPRDDQVFYVGKGKGNRVFSHRIETEEDSEKIKQIKDIESAGFNVKRNIIHYGLNEQEAFVAETALINYIGLNNLTNISLGHHSKELLDVETINQELSAEKLDSINHKVLIIKMNHSWSRNLSDKDVYEMLRGHWKASLIKAQKVELVFGVYLGIIKAVYIPTQWVKIHRDSDISLVPRGNETNLEKILGRVYFEGVKASDDILNLYLNKDIFEFVKSAQNPIKYINV